METIQVTAVPSGRVKSPALKPFRSFLQIRRIAQMGFIVNTAGLGLTVRYRAESKPPALKRICCVFAGFKAYRKLLFVFLQLILRPSLNRLCGADLRQF
ncbi:hypothetical protein CS542_00100 [Pedobacter sp. IW39]|nr:hypothetical protein CS542_00100 [Pedobacter sp. IW39]